MLSYLVFNHQNLLKIKLAWLTYVGTANVSHGNPEFDRQITLILDAILKDFSFLVDFDQIGMQFEYV